MRQSTFWVARQSIMPRPHSNPSRVPTWLPLHHVLRLGRIRIGTCMVVWDGCISSQCPPDGLQTTNMQTEYGSSGNGGIHNADRCVRFWNRSIAVLNPSPPEGSPMDVRGRKAAFRHCVCGRNGCVGPRSQPVLCWHICRRYCNPQIRSIPFHMQPPSHSNWQHAGPAVGKSVLHIMHGNLFPAKWHTAGVCNFR